MSALLWALRTPWLDLRFGGYAGGRRRSRFAHLQSNDVHNIGYRAIDHAFEGVPISSRDVLVDVGCGRGRALNYWLARGLPARLVGVEVDPEIASRTRERLRRFPQVEVISGDAVALTPSSATVCYLFNPFGGPVVKRWHDAALARATGDRLTVVYVYPLHLHVFRESGRWTIGVRRGVGFGDVAVMERRG